MSGVRWEEGGAVGRHRLHCTRFSMQRARSVGRSMYGSVGAYATLLAGRAPKAARLPAESVAGDCDCTRSGHSSVAFEQCCCNERSSAAESAGGK